MLTTDHRSPITAPPMTIPFLNLKALHDPIRDEIEAAIKEVINRNAFAGGPFVEAFENDFARYCQCPHAVGVGSGTDALWLALLALGVGPGDEVITVPNTFIATAEAITYCGAKPVFIDIEESTYNMNPALLEGAITPQTKAIIPVHLFGQMADMDPIMAIANQHHLPVIEDACQAHGAEYKGKRAGSIGLAGCFSFYPGKNLGAFGEAGAVVTHDSGLADKIKILRDHGQSRKYHHQVVGWNGRMDGIQGAVLQVKLQYLEAGNTRRRENARLYDSLLADCSGLIRPREAAFAKHVYHLYAVRVPGRDAFLNALAEKGIGCAIHYPVPLHIQEAYRSLGFKEGSFPVSERCQSEFVSLPMFPDLTGGQIETVAREAKAYLKG
jgi:dTDP-4-amino-4,6-dideoxygalactose transaminase